jgi:hypothetical protein
MAPRTDTLQLLFYLKLSIPVLATTTTNRFPATTTPNILSCVQYLFKRDIFAMNTDVEYYNLFYAVVCRLQFYNTSEVTRSLL